MINITQWLKHTALASIICIIPATGFAAASFLQTDKPFYMIEDEHSRNEAWGTCVAVYDLMSIIQKEESPATSEQMAQTSHGAKIALYMDYFLAMDSEANSSQVSARDKMGKLLMESIPETQLTAMFSAGEQMKHSEEWFALLTSTLKLCLSNLEQQQMLINTWRELYASGAFE